MAMLGRWPAWCQLSWRSIGRNGLMSVSKATGIRRSVVEDAAWCRRIRSRSQLGKALEHLRTKYSSLHIIARSMRSLGVVAGVNVTRPNQLLLGPGRGSMVAWARAFDAADRPAPRLFLGTLHLRT
jgi:hypothetical protein